MYIITGGAGFIGSNLLWEMNQQGISDVLIVDNLASTEKWKNLVGLKYTAYMHRDEFIKHIHENTLEKALQPNNNVGNKDLYLKIDGIMHLGACSSTTERNADFLIQNNLNYSKAVCDFALKNDIRFIHASSAATYGDGSNGFDDDMEQLDMLRPLNMYGYSKHLFDLWAKRTGRFSKIASVKFFNVYGPNEYHKGDMRSMVEKSTYQILNDGKVSLFKSHKPEYQDGGQLRDFVYSKDCARVLFELLQKKEVCGIFNIGTGKARSWKDLANAVFTALGKAPNIEYHPMPEILQGKYQYFTQAKMSRLSSDLLKGCTDSGIDEDIDNLPALWFRSLEDGVKDYVQNYLLKDDKYLSL